MVVVVDKEHKSESTTKVQFEHLHEKNEEAQQTSDEMMQEVAQAIVVVINEMLVVVVAAAAAEAAAGDDEKAIPRQTEQRHFPSLLEVAFLLNRGEWYVFTTSTASSSNSRFNNQFKYLPLLLNVFAYRYRLLLY